MPLHPLQRSVLLRVSSLIEALAARIRDHVSDEENGFNVPAGAKEYLYKRNPKLSDLKQRYRSHPATTHSLWSEGRLKRELKLPYFRGDNVYLFQKRYSNGAGYALTAQYVCSHDELNLFKKLTDDDLFGNCLVTLNNHLKVSRDLLDSILEINFLNRYTDCAHSDALTVVDIGAGYGRLAHRLVKALPNVKHIFCADAVPESTFLSDYYLKFRKVDHKATAVPLDEIEETVARQTVDLAVNIHSFGECTFKSITWWLDLLEKNSVRFLFIVANGEELGSTEPDRSNIDYLPAILDHGYKLKIKQPKYSEDPIVQRHGLYPTYYYLFER